MKDSLGDRIKSYYENPWKTYLPRRMPMIIRVDGKAFHTLTKECEKPFDTCFMGMMDNVAIELCKQIQGTQIAYVQSDEISLLVHDYKRLNSDAWFGKELQKICSVAASIAGATMTMEWAMEHTDTYYNDIVWSPKIITFDARAFVLPEAEVCNYFIWRQKDAERNSLSMFARSHFSHKELLNKNSQNMHEMLHGKNVNWNDLPPYKKRGRCVMRFESLESTWNVDRQIPVFTEERGYIESYLLVEEE